MVPGFEPSAPFVRRFGDSGYLPFDQAPVALLELDLSGLARWLDARHTEGVADLGAYFSAHPEAPADCCRQVMLVTANPAGVRLAGAPSVDALRGPLDGVVGRETMDMFVALAGAVFQGQHDIQIESVARALDGRLFDIQITLDLPRDPLEWNRVVIAILDVTRRRRQDRVLQEIADGVSGVVGTDFLRSAVSAFANTLGASHAMIAEIPDVAGEWVRSLAYTSNGTIASNVSYALFDTPCAGVARGEMCVIAEGVRSLFPRDQMLVESGAQGYAGVPLRDSKGTVVGLMTVMFQEPITDQALVESALTIFGARSAAELERLRGEDQRDNLQRRLSQAQKMESIGRLAGGIAHDFNNLLTPILGAAELARMRAGEDPDLQLDLDQISEAAERGARLTRQLLQFSRRQILSLQLLDINRVVSDFTNLLRRIVREDVEITTELNAPPAGVRADQSQIEQVLMNLAVNAQDAMPEGGNLTIRTTGHQVVDGSGGLRPGPYVGLSVIDTGSGIPAEILAHVFEPFFTTKSVENGTGLGLATVYGVVTQHGGTVRVDSAEGVGSSFEILLPIEGPAGSLPDDRVDDEPIRRGHGRVLLVEDDDEVRALAQRMLEELGYHVVPAANPEVALTLGRTIGSEFDLLLTDVVMPGMTGVQLHARMLEEGLRCPVMYMSGYSVDILPQGRGPASPPVLEKPFTLRELARGVEAALAEAG